MNLKITLSAEYEDKYGGHANFEEEVSADILDLKVTEGKIDEAVGRLIKHLDDFRSQPLPMEDDEEESGEAPQSEREAYHIAHS